MARKKIMLAENHAMQVLYKKNFYRMTKSCYARVFFEKDMHEIMLWKFFGTTKNIMLWEIML